MLTPYDLDGIRESLDRLHKLVDCLQLLTGDCLQELTGESQAAAGIAAHFIAGEIEQTVNDLQDRLPTVCSEPE